MDNEILIKLAANSENFKSGIKDANNSIEDMMRTITNSTKSWEGLALGAGAVGVALYGLAQMTANYGDHLLELSDKTGMTVEDLSLLKYAAEQSNTSIEAISESSKFLNKNLIDAAGGNEKAATSFRALGLDVDKLMKMPIKDRFLAMADAISSVHDSGMRSSLAIDTMGRSAAEMLPMMKDGAAGIRALMGEADALGVKMSTETAKNADAFNDSLAKLWTVIKQVGYDIGTVLLPPLQWVFEILVKITGFVTNTFIATIHMLNGMLLTIAQAAVALARGLTEVTDRLGLTHDASKKVAEAQETLKNMSIEAARSMFESMNKAGEAVIGVAHAEENLSDKKKANINLTDKQRIAILGEAEAEKQRLAMLKQQAEDEKKLSEGYIAYADRILTYKKTINKYDDEYFRWYSNKMNAQGYDEKKVAQMVTEEKKRLKAGELQTVISITALEEQAVKGVATVIKSLWSDNQTTFKQAWQSAADVFVDVMGQMMVQSMVASKAIQVDMAAATAGITLLIGLIASVFTTRGGSQSALMKATDEFLKNLRTALRSFEDEIMTTMEKLARSVKDGMTAMLSTADLIDRIMEAAARVANTTGTAKVLAAGGLDKLRTELVNQLPEIKDAIIERYNLEKSLINDVFGLLKQQQGFVRDVNKSITDVTRATYTKDEMFAAQKGDIQTLLAAINGTTGEDRVAMANDLKQAYLAYFDTAKDLFSGSNLAAIQQEVIAGLQNVKGFGISGFDQLIDINLQMLGVQRSGADLQAQMTDLMGSLNKAVENSFGLLEKIATADAGALPALFAALSSVMSQLGFEIPAMASGAVVTKATVAMIGEGGDTEIVSPVKMLRDIIRQEMGAMAGGAGTLQVILPNVKDARDMTERDWMEVLKKFRFATRRMGENGYSLGI